MTEVPTRARILAIETATEACSVALWLDGDCLERHQRAPRAHARHLLPWVEALLAEAGLSLNALDAVAFGRGPGSFTGLRLAAGTTQGLALGAGLPVVPVSSLRALALSVLQERPQTRQAPCLLTALDARMDEVYWCVYRPDENGLPQPLCAETVSAAAEVPVPAGADPGLGVGSGWGAWGDVLAQRCGVSAARAQTDSLPRASAVAHLAAWALASGEGAVDPARAQPVYLRDRVAQKPGA